MDDDVRKILNPALTPGPVPIQFEELLPEDFAKLMEDLGVQQKSGAGCSTWMLEERYQRKDCLPGRNATWCRLHLQSEHEFVEQSFIDLDAPGCVGLAESLLAHGVALANVADCGEEHAKAMLALFQKFLSGPAFESLAKVFENRAVETLARMLYENDAKLEARKNALRAERQQPDSDNDPAWRRRP